MQRPLFAASVIGLLAGAPAANAQLSYSYAQGALLTTESDTVAGEQDGKAADVSFSYDVLRFLHVFAGYKYHELDDLPVELTTVQAGAGFNFDVSDRQSVFINLSAVTFESDVATGIGTFGADDDGYGYAIGYRESNDRRLEFQVSAEHVELSDSDYADTWITTSLQLRVTPRLKVEGGVTFLGEENSLRIGVRYYLPNRLIGD
jgi:hypothetical protein